MKLAFTGVVAATLLFPRQVEAQPKPIVPREFRRLPALPVADRNTGPFCMPSLSAIKLIIDGQSAQWYFTNFLTVDPIGAYVKRYLPTSFVSPTLPSDISSSGTPRHVPGTFPSNLAQGLHDTKFQLSCFRYSRRFGGSVELEFRDEETYEYDARDASFLWDMDDVKLSVFLVPRANQLNTAVAGIGSEAKYLELNPKILLAYSIDAASRIAADASDQRVAFNALWTATTGNLLSSSSAGTFRIPVGAFVHGFIHYLFRDTLTGTNRGSMLELDENHIAVTTTSGTAIVTASLRVTDIDLTTSTFQSGTKLTLRATASWDATLTDQFTFDLENRTSTSSHTFITFPLTACPTSGSPTVNVTGTYREEFPWGDDTNSIGNNSVTVDCNRLQSAALQSDWGSVTSTPLAFAEDEDGTQVGSLNIVVAFSVHNR
jgi:hypothetical protein